MSWDVDLSAVGTLLAEPARCRMLLALADRRALPATELAQQAHVAASTASGHLARLVNAGWLEVETHGRHRYYRLANEEIGEVLEGMARLAPPQPVRSLSADLRRRQLRRARTCYGHLAGRLGVALFAGMLGREWIEGHDGSFRAGIDRLGSPGRDVVYRLTPDGSRGLGSLGVHAPGGAGLRHCIDWTEQRHHLAGALGTQLADRLLQLG